MTVPSGLTLLIDCESTNSRSTSLPASTSATTFCAFCGMKMTVCVALGARSNEVEDRVKKHAGYEISRLVMGGSHGVGEREGLTVGLTVGEGVGSRVGPVVGEVVGLSVGREVTGSAVGDSVGLGVG